MSKSSTVKIKLGHNANNRSNIFIDGHGILHEGETAVVRFRDVQPGGKPSEHIRANLLEVLEGELCSPIPAPSVGPVPTEVTPVETTAVAEADTVVAEPETPSVATEPKKSTKRAAKSE